MSQYEPTCGQKKKDIQGSAVAGRGDGEQQRAQRREADFSLFLLGQLWKWEPRECSPIKTNESITGVRIAVHLCVEECLKRHPWSWLSLGASVVNIFILFLFCLPTFSDIYEMHIKRVLL